MIGLLSNPWAILVIAIALAGSHLAAYTKGKHNERLEWEAKMLVAERAAHDNYIKEVNRGNTLSQAYEAEKTRNHGKARTIA